MSQVGALLGRPPATVVKLPDPPSTSMEATEPLLALGGPGYHRFGTWLMVLGLYDLIFALVGYAVFDFLLDNWDRSTIKLPFSLIAGVVGDPVRVSADASNAELESARLALEAALNSATEQAYAIADGRIASGARG